MGHVASVLVDDLARVRDQFGVARGVAHSNNVVVGAPHDQGGAGDLGEAVAEVVVEVGAQRLDETGLAAAADLLGDERRGQLVGVADDQAEGDVAQPPPAREGVGVGGAPADDRGDRALRAA